MLKHGGQGLEQQIEVGLGEAGALGKLGVDENVGAIEAVGHDMFATHGSVFGSLVVAGRLVARFLFGRISRCHARD